MADSLAAIVAKVVADPVVPPRVLRPEIPEPLERTILWCLEKDPDRRPPTVQAIVPQLRLLASPRGQAAADSIERLGAASMLATGIHIDVRGVTPPATAPSSRRSRLAPFILAGVLTGLTAAAMAVCWLAIRGAADAGADEPALPVITSEPSLEAAVAAQQSASSPVAKPESLPSPVTEPTSPTRSTPPSSSSRMRPPRAVPPPTPDATTTPDPFDRF